MPAFFDPLKQQCLRLYAFARYVAIRFFADDCLESAAFLWFASVLALVPLTAVVFSIFSIFPLFGEWKDAIEGFIFTNFVPASGEVLQEYTRSFVEQTRKMTLAGTIFLFVTSIMLMSSIERIFNRIWRARRNRSWSRRLVVYWSSLTLGPLILGASLGLSSYLLSVALISDAVDGLGGANQLLKLTPVLSAFVGIMLMYLIVPNHRVRLKHAAVGALVAALLFEAAKYGFVAYITYFPTYQKIYGALAVIPIFMLWAYLSWVVVLIGASVAAAMEAKGVASQDESAGASALLYHVYRALGQLHQAQAVGKGLTMERLHANEPGLQHTLLTAALALLSEKKWIVELEDEGWILRRDLNQATIGQLLVLIDPPLLTHTEREDPDCWDQQWSQLCATTRAQLQGVHAGPLAEMYASSPTQKPGPGS